MSTEKTRLEGIRERDAKVHASWFDVDDTDDSVLRVEQTIAARAIKDRRWLLERVDDLEKALRGLRREEPTWPDGLHACVHCGAEDDCTVQECVNAAKALAALHAKETD